MKKMKVCKFGGSSVADATQVNKIVDIVLADPDRKIVVVSAPGKRNKEDTKVTDMLILCADEVLAGKCYEKTLKAIVERYAEIQRELNLSAGVVAEIEKDLRERVKGDTAHRGMFMDCMKTMLPRLLRRPSRRVAQRPSMSIPMKPACI
jgi:aspartate kinase